MTEASEKTRELSVFVPDAANEDEHLAVTIHEINRRDGKALPFTVINRMMSRENIIIELKLNQFHVMID